MVELSGYVSNAWDYEYGTPEAAVAAFLHEEPELRESAAEGISEVLSATVDEPDRRLLLRDFGWGYAPPRSGMLDDFLVWTRDALRDRQA